MARDKQAELTATFLECLAQATRRIHPDYFMLPIQGHSPVYRERVYCYELYHQLRIAMGDSFGAGHRLGGEVDKGGHPLRRARRVTGIPDLLVHTPGDMGGNLIVMEVKATKEAIQVSAIHKDLEKLATFTSIAGYVLGIYLLFGPDADKVDFTIETSKRWMENDVRRDLQQVRLLWHAEPGTPAVPKPWPFGIVAQGPAQQTLAL